MRARAAAAACLAAAALAGACGGGDRNGGDGAGRVDGVTVFAAASLTEAFRDLAADFERRHPGRPVTLNLAGSQVLAGQILQGAPADVFASADSVQMRRVARAGLVEGSPRVFALNELVIAVAEGNPLEIRGPADLARDGVLSVLAAPEVPAGRYARRALDAAGVEPRPASLETDVKQVLAKVALGEADAGVVYSTDVRSAGGRVEAVPLAGGGDAAARYVVARLPDAPHPDAARAFVDFLLSRGGRDVLAAHGFGAP